MIHDPTCFEDLSTVNGLICVTYWKTYRRIGLLGNNNHSEVAKTEALPIATADQIRELYAIILALSDLSCTRMTNHEFENQYIYERSSDSRASAHRQDIFTTPAISPQGSKVRDSLSGTVVGQMLK